jgi:light-regulated signal transduction histidine kinase (bacteriophytochrome)
MIDVALTEAVVTYGLTALVRDLLQGRSTEATRECLEYAVGHLHGGRIDLESKEGAGATFTIALPIPDAKE